MSETYIIPNPAIDGWMDEKELNWLYTTALEMASVVEVGSWRGRSTSALLSGCKGPVFAVDTWKGSPDEINGTHADAVTQDIFAQFWGDRKSVV